MVRSEISRKSTTATEPQDAHRGRIGPAPADPEEARADRAMAAAERAVAEGTASDDQRAGVERMAGARTHEERRAAFRQD